MLARYLGKLLLLSLARPVALIVLGQLYKTICPFSDLVWVETRLTVVFGGNFVEALGLLFDLSVADRKGHKILE